MANLPEKPAAALLGIVHPMIASNETGVNAVMQDQRFLDLFKKRFHLHGHGSKSTVEPDHQHEIAAIDFISTNDFRQIDFVQAERLLTEDVFAGFEPCQNLGRMQVMPRSDDKRVYSRVVEQPLLLGRAVLEAKLLCCVAGMRTVCATHPHQLNVASPLECREERTHSKVACSEKTYRH